MLHTIYKSEFSYIYGDGKTPVRKMGGAHAIPALSH